MRSCATLGCPLPHHARGRCARHYWRARRTAGWRQERHYVPVERARPAAAAAPLALRLYLSTRSLRAVAAELTRRGVPTRGGGPWSHASALVAIRAARDSASSRAAAVVRAARCQRAGGGRLALWEAARAHPVARRGR